jgi:hypothetical protein
MSIDVPEWLRGLGLEQYTPAFAEHDIDAEVLPELTADDLGSASRRSATGASCHGASRGRGHR